MKVNIVYDADVDVIEIPEGFLEVIEAKMMDFFAWVSNSENGYVIEKDGIRGSAFETAELVLWINEFVLDNCDHKAKVCERSVDIVKAEYPKIVL